MAQLFSALLEFSSLPPLQPWSFLRFFLFSVFQIRFFGYIVLRPFGLIIPLLAVVGAYFLNQLFFSQNFYPEKFNEKIKTENNIKANLSFLNRFGIIGEIISVELKLILRHKRTKSILYMSGSSSFFTDCYFTPTMYI